VQQYGAAAIAYLDESGFEPDYPQLYAWAPRGQKVHGERNAQRRPRQNLLAARQGDAFLATMLISGSVNAEVFETWLAEHLEQPRCWTGYQQHLGYTKNNDG
jgi:hypothetical protein